MGVGVGTREWWVYIRIAGKLEPRSGSECQFYVELRLRESIAIEKV
jgi:hypothetical protein